MLKETKRKILIILLCVIGIIFSQFTVNHFVKERERHIDNGHKNIRDLFEAKEKIDFEITNASENIKNISLLRLHPVFISQIYSQEELENFLKSINKEELAEIYTKRENNSYGYEQRFFGKLEIEEYLTDKTQSDSVMNENYDHSKYYLTTVQRYTYSLMYKEKTYEIVSTEFLDVDEIIEYFKEKIGSEIEDSVIVQNYYCKQKTRYLSYAIEVCETFEELKCDTNNIMHIVFNKPSDERTEGFNKIINEFSEASLEYMDNYYLYGVRIEENDGSFRIKRINTEGIYEYPSSFERVKVLKYDYNTDMLESILNAPNFITRMEDEPELLATIFLAIAVVLIKILVAVIMNIKKIGAIFISNIILQLYFHILSYVCRLYLNYVIFAEILMLSLIEIIIYKVILKDEKFKRIIVYILITNIIPLMNTAVILDSFNIFW